MAQDGHGWAAIAQNGSSYTQRAITLFPNAPFRLNPATRIPYAGPMELSPYTAATLATKSHVFCVGTLAQCLRRWNRLPSQNKADTFLKMGRDGVAPTILRGDQIEELASNPKLIRA